MGKIFFLFVTLLLWTHPAGLWAQGPDTSAFGKMDALLRLQLRQAGYEETGGVLKRSALRRSRVQGDTVFRLLVRCADSEALAAGLRDEGYEAHPIVPTLCVAASPASRLSRLARHPGVERLCGSRTARPLMDVSRRMTGMDRVTAGEGLDSPFDGTGVVVGIIDQGFEYNHPAFSTPEGDLRIKYLWDSRQGREPLTDPDSIRAAENDGPDEVGHATHVSNIAAGSPVAGAEGLHGYAPGAELAFVPSKFSDVEVLLGARRVIDLARRQGKPCVFNMSFGSFLHSHDGLTSYEQALNELSDEGVLFVAAAGNNGAVAGHVEKRFASERDTLRLLFEPGKSSSVLYSFFRNDDAEAMSYGVSLYDPQTQAMYALDKEELFANDYALEESEGGVPGSSQFFFAVDWATLSADWKLPEDYRLVLSIFGAPPGSVLHGWAEAYAYFGDGGREDGFFTPGDNAYSVAVPASAGQVLAVASYDSRASWTGLDGEEHDMSETEVGHLSYFSSLGPMLDAGLKKPFIAAPGALILSAYSGQAAAVEKNRERVSLRVTQGGADYYYGAMQGTSLASPQVTGIVACWLQAYPKLTPEELHEIVRLTAINDEFTGPVRDSWDAGWGYGKIDAYAGLKECLRRAAATGLREEVASEEPVSFRIGGREARVLFNGDEPEATLRLCTLGGVPVEERRLQAVSCAHEEVVSLEGCAPGCYLLTVQTARAQVARKIAVP